jgi:hypothetical protein
MSKAKSMYAIFGGGKIMTAIPTNKKNNDCAKDVVMKNLTNSSIKI